MAAPTDPDLVLPLEPFILHRFDPRGLSIKVDNEDKWTRGAYLCYGADQTAVYYSGGHDEDDVPPSKAFFDLQDENSRDRLARWMSARVGPNGTGLGVSTTAPQWRWDTYRGLWVLTGGLARQFFGSPVVFRAKHQHDENVVLARDGSYEMGGIQVPTLVDCIGDNLSAQSLLADGAVRINVVALGRTAMYLASRDQP